MDIIDTVVKIIVGAVVGGLAIYYLLKEKLDQQQRNKSLRRIDLLEEVAQHIGRVTHVFSKYASLINEVSGQSERMSSKQQQELDALGHELVEVYEEVSMAESKLLLLGEKRLEKAMKLYTSKIALYRKQFYPGRFSGREELSNARKEINQMREQFYDILSERYDQIMA